MQTKSITHVIQEHQWVEPASLAALTVGCILLGFYAQEFAQAAQASLFYLSDWGSF